MTNKGQRRRYVVEDHLRTCGVYDCKRGKPVASGMTKALARKVARMLNDEYNEALSRGDAS